MQTKILPILTDDDIANLPDMATRVVGGVPCLYVSKSNGKPTSYFLRFQIDNKVSYLKYAGTMGVDEVRMLANLDTPLLMRGWSLAKIQTYHQQRGENAPVSGYVQVPIEQTRRTWKAENEGNAESKPVVKPAVKPAKVEDEQPTLDIDLPAEEVEPTVPSEIVKTPEPTCTFNTTEKHIIVNSLWNEYGQAMKRYEQAKKEGGIEEVQHKVYLDYVGTLIEKVESQFEFKTRR